MTNAEPTYAILPAPASCDSVRQWMAVYAALPAHFPRDIVRPNVGLPYVEQPFTASGTEEHVMTYFRALTPGTWPDAAACKAIADWALSHRRRDEVGYSGKSLSDLSNALFLASAEGEDAIDFVSDALGDALGRAIRAEQDAEQDGESDHAMQRDVYLANVL